MDQWFTEDSVTERTDSPGYSGIIMSHHVRFFVFTSIHIYSYFKSKLCNYVTPLKKKGRTVMGGISSATIHTPCLW